MRSIILLIFLVAVAGLTGCQTIAPVDRAKETEYFDWNDPYVNRDQDTLVPPNS